MNSIFISYRRDSASGYGGRLHEELSERFGPDRVFRDIDSIRPGTDFTQVIREAVARSGVVLALIGREWLSVTNGKGQRRLDDPNDFVRLELAAAIEQDIIVIPVLLERARVPASSELPAPLADLGRYQGIELSEDRWQYDVSRLATRLGEIVGPPAPGVLERSDPAPASPNQPAESSPRHRSQGRSLAVGAAVVAVIVAFAAALLLRGETDPPTEPAPPREVQVHVSARGPENASGFGMRWTDTGIEVDDQVVRIEATGLVNAGDGIFVPPDGTPDRPDFDVANVLRGAQHAGLIGKFGRSGQPFVVGSHYRSFGQTSGRLYLGINDIDAQNNQGEFVATITVA